MSATGPEVVGDHDLDLMDARFRAPDASTVGTLIEGLQLTAADDDRLLERGITIFESMHRARMGPTARIPVRRRRPAARARGK